jgi:hypothetical protein
MGLWIIPRTSAIHQTRCPYPSRKLVLEHVLSHVYHTLYKTNIILANRRKHMEISAAVLVLMYLSST